LAELAFFSGTMDCGKSTLALQIRHNRSARGLTGMIFTRNDRAGEGRISSRLGLVTEAVEAGEDFDFHAHLVRHLTAGGRVDYVIADEAQFLSAEQVDQLARIVDDLGIDVFAFGITTDFRTRLFPGSQRLIELADRVESLQVESLCWCGARATHNARRRRRGRRPGRHRVRGAVPAPPPAPVDRRRGRGGAAVARRAARGGFRGVVRSAPAERRAEPPLISVPGPLGTAGPVR
jgi:thymidine kinase